ncbi:MAG: multicomponent Na+:H+ antiporter subunit A [Yoonia sp.]|jgi:multicomponent Na+:H+ antiporter subunit A
MAGIASGSKALTRMIQTGVLRHYMLVTFGTALMAMGVTLFIRTTGIPSVGWPDIELWDWLVVLLVLMGAGLTVITNSRITAIAGLGVVGIGMAMIFILYSAPDVAITQLLVETLVVVLFAAAALKLPSLEKEHLRDRTFDAILAIGFGVVTTIILMKVTAGPIDRELTTFFETASWPEAYGQNIVNVILVDFRALDTFGEIAVVLIAAISIFALLKSKPEEEKP